MVNLKIGLGNVLTLIFVVLKLTGNIAWSWWWVLSPTWIPILLIIIFFAVILILAALGGGGNNVNGI